MGHSGAQVSYESLPAPPELHDPEQESILGSLKRFFVPSAPPPPIATPGTSTASTPQREASPARPVPNQSRKDASLLPSAHQKLSALASAVRSKTPAPTQLVKAQKEEEGSPDPNASGITLPNGQKYTRRLRLSNVTPAVGVTVQNSDRGALITSSTSRSLAGGEHGWTAAPGTTTTGSGAGGGGISGSPTTSEAFGGLTFKNLSSIPGFPLRGGDHGEDAKSAWSVSTTANASPTVVQIFRRLQGEGLSQEYWMKDESSKACYDCETVFTVFRRKHHCRICGQIFCARCAAHLIPSARFGQQGHIRVCNLCFSKADHHARQHPHSHHHHSVDDSLSTSHSHPVTSHYRPSYSQRPSSISNNFAPRASRPSSLYQSVSYPTWEHGAIESIPQEDEDDGGPSRPRSPDADEVNDGEGAEDDSPRGRRSPISSMRIQQEEREASRTRGEDGEGPETAYSPSLSTATAPFRRELAEDEEGTAARRERSSEAEDEQTEQEELDEAKNGLGISMQVNGLGLDMADISGSPPSAPSEHKHRDGDLTPMTLEQALETGLTSSAVSQRRDSFTRFSRPASPSVLNSSTSSGIRQSPAVPPFNRSISRLSLSIPDGLRPQFSHLISGSDSLEHHQQLPYDLPHEAPRDIPLSDSALLHIRKMIHQALAREEVPNSKAWEPVLERLLLELTEGPVPDIKNGDAMDVRRYVRIKKLPGGRPKDSEFIDGVIFTKNLLHKKMPRSIEQPRIAVVTFRVELERPGPHYLQLEKHISQEDGHLQNMAKRLADVRPHLILFSENVPRLALESLADRGIAVAKHVKPEAIAAVSRATRATVIDSLDILATQPELGRCKNFRVQTFAHEEIPEGRKTFLRFEGCKRELGCTILLRGGTMETLMKIKKIVNMLALVVYNAKLEGYLFWDEHLDIVASPSDSFPAASLDDSPPTSSQHVQPGEDLSATVKLENSKSRLITQSLDPYRSTALSSSSLVRFPPPYPLVRMADEDRHLRELRDTRDADETRKIIEEEAASRAQSISAGSSSTSLSSSHQPSISSVLIDAATLAQGASTQKVLQKPEDVAKMQEVAEAEERYSERLVVWKEYREKNQDSFDPEDHQQLFILESLLHGRPDEPKKVCKPPAVVAVTFYGSEDLTISQYINRIIHEFSQECTSPSCHQPLSEHSRIFVHGDCRIQISIDPHAPPSPDANFPADWIGLQTSCERCNCQSRLVRMSDSTSRLSFHKFLELSFYPSERLVCGDQNCPHDAHLDHVRYWYYSGARIMITMQRIDLRDVVPPPRNVKVKPDTQLLLRNSEYEVVQQRTKAFFDSVQARINAFRLDCVQIQRLDECKAALADFSSRCEADRRTVLRLLVSAYEQSQETNGTEMTGVRRALQEKVVQFEGDWTVFEKRVILSEQDSRRSGKRYSPDSMLSLSPGRRSVSGSLPPSIEVEEEATASSSEAVNSATSSTNDSRHAAESSVDSTSTFRTTSPDLASLSPLALEPPALSINDVSPTSLSPVDEPFPSSVADLGASTSTLKGAGPRLSIPSDNSDMESDSTICADSRYPSISGASSPFIRNQPRRSNETSPAEESEPDEQRPVVRRRKTGQLVSEIIQSFESGSIGRSDSMRSTKTAKSPDRPLLRRGHTDKPRATKIRQPGPFALSDGDNSYARNVGVFHLLDSPAAAKPTRIPAPTRSREKATFSLDHLAQATSNRLSPPGSPTSSRPASRASTRLPGAKSFSRTRSPPSSRPQSPTLTRGEVHRSPNTSRSRPTSPIATRSRPPLKSAGSSRSTIKGKATERDQSSRISESSDASRPPKPKPRGLGLSRPTASTTNKMVGRRVVSTGVGRVKQMSKQWEGYAARQAQRKRARPVIATQPTVQIFTNVRDAAKEDSDDEAHHSHNESDGADDEFDNDPDGGEKEEEETSDREEQQRGRSVSSKTPPKPAAEQLISCSTPNVSMADALVRAHHHNTNENAPTDAPTDPMARDSDLLNLRPESAMYDLSNFASDSDYPSFPSSPMLGSYSNTMPRMSEGESSGTDKSSYFRGLLNGLFLFRNGEFSQLQYPLLPSEHLFSDNPILLRDDEPSSIIAFALSSKIYSQSVEATKLSPAKLGAQPDLASKEQPVPSIEDFLRRPDEASLRIATEDASLSASCKIFFAEHFEALRRQCGCEKQFIESLSRCYKWDSAGGKSKADFMKTLDDRFIVKQLSSWEVDVLSSFLPAYFSYLADCLFKGQPTVLAKIFGIYRISFGKKYKNLDFLVMENLFYGRQLRQIFDLKGSTRNRRADQNNPVLLDENLMEISLKTPIYVREESQNFIRQAIYNDSQFLSDLNVMDYSLVIGVDSAKQELVVGIVDFIRTYTWNKRIESWVKETTFIGGASKAGGPTIITPKQYKMRFREAIDGYLQLSPSPWLSAESLKTLTSGVRNVVQQPQQQAQSEQSEKL